MPPPPTEVQQRIREHLRNMRNNAIFREYHRPPKLNFPPGAKPSYHGGRRIANQPAAVRKTIMKLVRSYRKKRR